MKIWVVMGNYCHESEDDDGNIHEDQSEWNVKAFYHIKDATEFQVKLNSILYKKSQYTPHEVVQQLTAAGEDRTSETCVLGNIYCYRTEELELE